MIEKTIIITGVVISAALITCAAICGFALAGKVEK